MINANMRFYDFFTFGGNNAYGQAQLSKDVQGSIKMAINLTGQSVQDNINYKGASYIGLTLAPIDDTFVIQYGESKLKVLYVNPLGRYKQVFMAEI